MAEDTQVADSEDIMSLGGNIELSGFSGIDRDSMVVLKKMVGNYAKRFSESSKTFQRLSLHMKAVHEREKSEKYELHAKLLDNGKLYTSEMIDRNLFFAVDRVFKKIESEIE